MKKIVILLIFSLFFIIPISSAFYKIEYFCEDDFCVEDARVSFEILLVHYNLSTKYIGIELLSTGNNETIAINNNLDITVTPQNNASFSIFGFLPKNISKVELIPCFNLIPLDEDLKPSGKSRKICDNDFFTIAIVRSVRCETDADCSEEDYCKDSVCKPLRCRECGYIADHKCFVYECCSSESCKENQACVDNLCVNLNCNEDEYFENHQCKDCNIFQKAEEQGCSFNSRLFIKIILAIGIIAVVFGILYIKMKISY